MNSTQLNEWLTELLAALIAPQTLRRPKWQGINKRRAVTKNRNNSEKRNSDEKRIKRRVRSNTLTRWKKIRSNFPLSIRSN